MDSKLAVPDDELTSLGATVRQVPLGKQILDGKEIDLPPAILASIGNDPEKRTILIYGHFDVQPVSVYFRRFLGHCS